MKSAHQIASEIVDAWPYGANVTTANRAVLVSLIAEALMKAKVESLERERSDALIKLRQKFPYWYHGPRKEIP